MFSRRKIAALVAEFLGTAVLAFVVLTISRSQIGIPYFVAIAAGLAVMFMGVALNRDVALNPALTLGMWTGRRISTVKAISFIVAQLLGGMAAYALYKYFSGGHIQPLPTAYDSKVLIAEAVGTFVFAFIAAGVAYQRQHWLVRAVSSGAGLTLGIMIASVASAAFLNPAVALASNAWAWTTYVLGPVLGAVIGVNLYGLLFAGNDRSFAFAKAKNTRSGAVIERAEEVADLEAEDDVEVEDDEDVVVSNKSTKSTKKNKAKKRK